MTLPTKPSLEAARAEVAARVKAAADAWALLPSGYTLSIEQDNRAMVDLGSTTAERPFLTWAISFKPGYRASLGRASIARQLGQIIVSTKVKEGAGTASSLKLLDHVLPYLENRDLTVLSIHEAQVQDGFARQGWYFVPALLNFQLDRIIVNA